ncbi:MAG: hypothetical protein RLZ12_579 [Bacillota bacterium]
MARKTTKLAQPLNIPPQKITQLGSSGGSINVEGLITAEQIASNTSLQFNANNISLAKFYETGATKVDAPPTTVSIIADVITLGNIDQGGPGIEINLKANKITLYGNVLCAESNEPLCGKT